METVIALFVLAAAMIVSFQLFHRATAWQGEIELRATALAIAQSKIAELQVAAADLSEFSDGLSTQLGTQPAASNSAFQVTVAVDDLSAGGRERYSPSQAFEQTYAGTPPPQPAPVTDVFGGAVTDDRKKMAKSFLVADVTVASTSGRMQPITLTVLLREPPRAVKEVIVSAPTSLNVPYQAVTSCAAQVMDIDDNPIDDVVVKWSVKPISSYGTVYQARDGSLGVLQYVDYNHLDMPFQPVGGQCQLTATVRVEGQSVWDDSETISLGP